MLLRHSQGVVLAVIFSRRVDNFVEHVYPLSVLSLVCIFVPLAYINRKLILV